MRCGKGHERAIARRHESRNPHECAVAKSASQCLPMSPLTVATRTNALWQRTRTKISAFTAKVATRTNALWQRSQNGLVICSFVVATRTNALWQRANITLMFKLNIVATRTNALWQSPSLCHPSKSQTSQPARMRCGKDHSSSFASPFEQSQPARMRCGKGFCARIGGACAAVATRTNALWQSISIKLSKAPRLGRNPHECAVAKIDNRDRL